MTETQECRWCGQVGCDCKSDEEVEREAKRISELARNQLDGRYTTRSDAVIALTLIMRLADLLVRRSS
jgi:hypothetical protein